MFKQVQKDTPPPKKKGKIKWKVKDKTTWKVGNISETGGVKAMTTECSWGLQRDTWECTHSFVLGAHSMLASHWYLMDHSPGIKIWPFLCSSGEKMWCLCLLICIMVPQNWLSLTDFVHFPVWDHLNTKNKMLNLFFSAYFRLIYHVASLCHQQYFSSANFSRE